MTQKEYEAKAKKRLFDMSMPEPNTGCIIWIGDSVKGYGRSCYKGKKIMAHRLSYEINVSKIPEGLTIDHLCKNTYCINPMHLEAVTMKENTMRGRSFSSINAMKTKCSRGHSYDEENTYYYKDGRRDCKICMKIRYLKTQNK